VKGTITFVGFGLLASSAAAALKGSGHSVHIRAVSGAETCRRALEMGLADEGFAYEDIAHYLPGTDLLLLCSPISHILETLDAIAHADYAGAPILISDIGSTKLEICTRGAALPSPFHFVGGHPMAGSEKRSLEYHDASLFENAYWILCPPRDCAPEAYALLQELIDAVGAHGVTLDAAEHDHVMSRLSHVPQLVSTALASALPADIRAKHQQHLAGRGFRDMTRIAASPWPMWRDILVTNRNEILAGIEEMQASLQSIHDYLNDFPQAQPSLQSVFTDGNEVRASLSSPGKGFAQSLHELLLQIPDRPGAILQVIEPLTRQGINILDIELAKVREGVGGSLLLGFKTLPEAEKALSLLATSGFSARLRS